VKRLFDIVFSTAALVILAPLLLVAALGVYLSDGRPIIYRARRVGRGGTLFVMHKFRTMRADHGDEASPITPPGDKRVFRLGLLLRRLKIDEMPQFYDVLRGVMSLVGPRPEDPAIVRDHYAPEHMETLTVRPGLCSPGSIYNYTHGETWIGQDDPELDYVARLLPVKLALDLVYVRNISLIYDLRVIARTVLVIVLSALGRRKFADPAEMARADRIVAARTAERVPLSTSRGVTPHPRG
jgi:lipopolysaccharide/colanic/teichoic acid biosynthesis glycosyltransferase